MPPPPSLALMALTLRETKGNSEIIGPGPKEIGLSPIPSPNPSEGYSRTERGGRTSEGGGGGGGRLYNGTTRNQSISIAVLAVLQGRQAAGRKEEANAVSPIVVPMRHEASKRPAGRVARGGRGRVLLN